MPVKQVYGKRTKTTSSYAKFLSPDKDDFLREKPKANDAANNHSITHKDVAPVAEVELRLEALTLQEPVLLDGRDTAPTKRTRRPRNPLKIRNMNIEKLPDERACREEVALEECTAEQDTKAGTKEHARQPTRGSPRKQQVVKGAGARTKKSTPEPVQVEEPEARNSHARNPDERRNENHDAMPQDPQTPIRKARGRPKKKRSPTPPRMRQLPTPEPTPDPDDVYTAYVKSLLDVSDRRRIVSFEQWSSELDPYFEVTKIAEASFSEVFRLKVRSAVPGIGQEESVLKLIALRTPPNAPLDHAGKTTTRTRGKADAARQVKRELAAREEKDEWKSHVEDVLGEVRLLQNLNHIPGFTNFRELALVQGRPSATFGQAWRDWNRGRPKGKKSQFPDPTKKASYDDTQLWAVVEMQDAGTDCEKVMEQGGISTIWEIWDVFWGVCLSVAKAEEGCRFEHRDLHLENVCIRSSRPNTSLTEAVIKKPLSTKLGFTGLETTVIDYTLSRADVVDTSQSSFRPRNSTDSSSSDNSTSSSHHAPSNTEPDVAYLDLNKDIGLFRGDADLEYQYEIYRYMRSAVYYGDPLKQDEGELEPPPSELEYSPETPRRSPRKAEAPAPARSYCDPPTDIWRGFYPKTNLLWTHFILYKLLQNLPSENGPGNMSAESIMQNVRVSKAEDAHLVLKKAIRLHKILQKVELMLEPVVLGREGSLGSVKELVVMALEMRWLRAEDVIGSDGDGS
ncbi:hypothetical protein BDV96DRAFT_577656 [Lophiotrema nucula]|uniref:non-specific serine/threonine protein kinase n=1 Tax=Lophiotrema nucula TaxID=690887 RepID=A0A6A5Z3T7_9PLEO|nr:hypothetical protein BDV96DRAFT_577656 [Lophiotrema nucula]